ncbi:MAG: hypothetical protein AAFP84_09105, partial [Actinomycetota bacterium]
MIAVSRGTTSPVFVRANSVVLRVGRSEESVKRAIGDITERFGEEFKISPRAEVIARSTGVLQITFKPTEERSGDGVLVRTTDAVQNAVDRIDEALP